MDEEVGGVVERMALEEARHSRKQRIRKPSHHLQAPSSLSCRRKDTLTYISLILAITLYALQTCVLRLRCNGFNVTVGSTATVCGCSPTVRYRG